MNATQARAIHAPKAPIVIPDRVALRALRRFAIEGDCHISTLSVASHGYAQIGWKNSGDLRSVMTLAHRAAWVAVYGQIPDGMTVDHTCKSRRCVNVAHLRLMTNYENARRTSGRDWPLGECANGHPNEYLAEMSGRLRCAICVTESRRAWAERNRHQCADCERLVSRNAARCRSCAAKAAA